MQESINFREIDPDSVVVGQESEDCVETSMEKRSGVSVDKVHFGLSGALVRNPHRLLRPPKRMRGRVENRLGSQLVSHPITTLVEQPVDHHQLEGRGEEGLRIPIASTQLQQLNSRDKSTRTIQIRINSTPNAETVPY